MRNLKNTNTSLQKNTIYQVIELQNYSDGSLHLTIQDPITKAQGFAVLKNFTKYRNTKKAEEKIFKKAIKNLQDNINNL